MSSDQVIDYRGAATAAPNSRVTRLVLVVTLVIPASFVAFRLLRRHQLSLADPYNNAYMDWAAAFRLVFFALVLVDFVLLLVLRRRVARAALYFGWLVVLVSGAYMAWFIVGMLRFIYPEFFASSAGR